MERCDWCARENDVLVVVNDEFDFDGDARICGECERNWTAGHEALAAPVSDLYVCLACAIPIAESTRSRPELLRIWTGQSEEICYRAMERADRRGLIEYGVSLRWAWTTPEGDELIRKGDE